MSARQRGLALLAHYRRDEFADGEVFVFDGEPGVLWRKLNITSLVAFAMNHTGLQEGPINDAHRWMTDQGYRYSEGSGAGVKHYIRVSPAGSDSDGTAEEVEDALAAAMQEITRLTTQNDLLREENARLLAERQSSGEAPPSARALGMARQLKAMIDSE